MKGIIKANTVDKYLRPIRQQISELVAPDSQVIEFGCGNGDLLFRLSPKLKYGLGIDNSRTLIQYAMDQKEKTNISNIDFELTDITQGYQQSARYDYAIASLLLHILPKECSVELLKTMLNLSETLIICGFSKPESWKQSVLLWLDQRFTGHYTNFRAYQKHNNIEGLLKDVIVENFQCYDTFDPVIKVFQIDKN